MQLNCWPDLNHHHFHRSGQHLAASKPGEKQVETRTESVSHSFCFSLCSSNMNSFSAMLSEHVFEFANKAMGSHNRCLTLQKVRPPVFLIELINASIF